MLGGLVGGYDFDLDALFETGLRTLLDGFEQLIGRETAGQGPDPERFVPSSAGERA